MKKQLDIKNWNRKEHFAFFKNFDEPYYGVTVNLDCTRAYEKAKELGVSLYCYYLHKTLVAVNSVENFRYLVEGDGVAVCDVVDASTTILRDDNTFGFSYIRYAADLTEFNTGLVKEVERVRNTTGLITTGPLDCVIHFSVLPWINFSSISHATNKSGDSCPKISMGKITQVHGRKQMPCSIHVHHALVDGYHVGLFIDKLQDLLNE